MSELESYKFQHAHQNWEDLLSLNPSVSLWGQDAHLQYKLYSHTLGWRKWMKCFEMEQGINK